VLVASIGGGGIIQICSGGNKHTCLGWAVKMHWGDDQNQWGKKCGGRKKQKNVSVQYFVLIPSSTRLSLFRLSLVYFRLLCRNLFS